MGYFPVRYDSRVVIYERKMLIRLATGFELAFLADDAVVVHAPGEDASDAFDQIADPSVAGAGIRH